MTITQVSSFIKQSAFYYAENRLFLSVRVNCVKNVCFVIRKDEKMYRQHRGTFFFIFFIYLF